MYSETVRELLEDKNIEVGDTVTADGYKGKLMPKPESGDPNTLLIKLESGYNIGVKTREIELVEKTELTDTEKTEVTHKQENDDILVLHTGGTIASRVSYEEGGVKPAFDPEDLVEMYPELSEEVNIHSEVVAQMLSEDMEPGHWQEIAEKIDKVKDDYDGIIVGHGTDTMSFTGAALTLMLQNIDKGVLLVGSQRSSDRPSTDATMNMYCAGKFLSETDFNGFGVCMHASSNDDKCQIMPAAKVRKMHTSRRDAFKPINTKTIGTVNYETEEIRTSFEKSRENYEKHTELNKNIGFLKVRPGMKPEEIDFLIEQDYDGVIIEGTGLGHMPVNAFDDKTQHHEKILEKVKKLAEDTAVVLTSHCLNGRVNMNVYDAGLKIQNAGVIEAEDMHPELAYVKLMWSLGNSGDLDEALDLFQKNVNGEIQDRTMYSEH
jgi:glutamyl-tRNA(Gln) amidotransferase subunit D